MITAVKIEDVDNGVIVNIEKDPEGDGDEQYATFVFAKHEYENHGDLLRWKSEIVNFLCPPSEIPATYYVPAAYSVQPPIPEPVIPQPAPAKREIKP